MTITSDSHTNASMKFVFGVRSPLTAPDDQMAMITGCQQGNVDKSLFVRWIAQIQAEVAKKRPAHVQVLRLVNSLQFAEEGRIFATLRADTSGLFFREWTRRAPEDFSGLSLTEARHLVKKCLAERDQAVARSGSGGKSM